MGCGESKPATDTGSNQPAGTMGNKQASSHGFRDPSVTLQKLFSHKQGTTGDDKPKAENKGVAHRVRNVFATPLDAVDVTTYKPPVHKKTDAEKTFIRKALAKNFVFESMSPRDMYPLVMAFESHPVEKDETIIQQGDSGDYFYIIRSGTCAFIVDDKQVGKAKAGDSFGELALLYTCPRAATVKAIEPAELYRVDQTTFRYILQVQTEQGSRDKAKLLREIDFLKELDEAEMNKLVSVMTPKKFSEGDYLMRKGDAADYLYILQEGNALATDVGAGDAHYEDVSYGPGEYVGERALVTGDPRAANVIAKSEVLAFCIDKETFETVLGKLSVLILRSNDKRKLAGIKIIKDTLLDEQRLASLTRHIVDRSYKAGDTIFEEGKECEAALYLVREGKVSLTDKSGKRKEVVEAGGYFGDDQLLADVTRGKNSVLDPSTATPECSAKVTEDCVCGVLTLVECRKIFDTVHFGKGKERDSLGMSMPGNKIKMSDLKKHTILGAGTFGQVWLVSRAGSDGERRPYALKVQSKYELVKDGQAKAVVYEKNIQSQLNNPFIAELVNTYQDTNYVYMLMTLIQGGELYSLIHTNRRDGVSEKAAKFYALGIAEGLAYMHRRRFVYRDLKPENVLIDDKGYPVIVDFGFAKLIKDKTFTLCGTPLYLPPEVILNRGHNWAADHWSLGVLCFEMVTGYTPFYKEGMEQMDLFRAIVKGKYVIPPSVRRDASRVMSGFLTKDPAKRLGSLAGGEDDVFEEAWFADIDLNQLRRKEIKAPHVPKIKDPLDSSNFENWSHLDDKLKAKYPKLKPEQEAIFMKF